MFIFWTSIVCALLVGGANNFCSSSSSSSTSLYSPTFIRAPSVWHFPEGMTWWDSSPLILYSSHVRRRVGERWNNECLQPWWGCISASGVGDIVRIDGIINAEKYRQVLFHYAIPSGKHLIGNSFIFQCHNNLMLMPVKSYLERKIADWPPQSSDLNILEAVWDHMDRERNKGQAKSKEELWEVLTEA